GQLLLALEHEGGPALEDRRALERRRPAPRLERLDGHVGSPPRLLGTAVGDARHDLAVGGVPDLERRGSALPLPAQVPGADVFGSAHARPPHRFGLELWGLTASP